MDSSELAMLTLDLDIPNLWENALVENFPGNTFTIKQAGPIGDDLFSGLLKVKDANTLEIKKFLENYYPLISLEVFHQGSNLFHFLAPDNILPQVLRNSKSILSWPVNFLEKGKRVKFILKDKEIENVMVSLEDRDINIDKFSKVRMNFDLKEILTPKQKDILGPSIKEGYYQFPKKINLNELSKKIGVSPSTLCVHLQKIEAKILNSNYQDLFLGI